MSERAISYVRFSTRRQISGDSLERQLSKARDYAARHRLQLDELSYQDLGISAFRGKNATDGALRSFLDAIDAGSIPSNVTLLVENFDRLSRAQVQDALELFLSITKRGVTIVTLSDEQVYSRKTINANWTQLIITLATMARAHEESAIKSMRTKSGLQAAQARGLKHPKCPSWMVINADRRGYTIHEDRADLIRKVFDLRVSGRGSLKIAKHLNDNHGFNWGSPQVAALLKNPAVIGTRKSQVGYAPLFDYYPAIVDIAVFQTVHELLTAAIGTKRGRRPEDEPNLFTGIAFCALCPGSMQFFRESKHVKQRYLRCRNSLSKAHACTAASINYDAFEKEAIGWLLLDQDEDVIPLLQKKISPQQVSNAEVVALKERQSKLLDLYVSGGLTDKAVVTEKLNVLSAKIQQLEATVVKLPSDERMFAERAWELVERHENARLGDDKEAFYAVRGELRSAFARAIERIHLFPDSRVDDVHHCKFSVEFRGYDGKPVREYTRPALNNVKGALNGHPRHRTALR